MPRRRVFEPDPAPTTRKEVLLVLQCKVSELADEPLLTCFVKGFHHVFVVWARAQSVGGTAGIACIRPQQGRCVVVWCAVLQLS
jgi:hypothetical protein